MGRMISSLCNTISLNHLACQPRVARSPIHVRTTFKEVGRQPSSPRFFFHLVRRVLKFSMFYLCRSLTMRETHTHTHRLIASFRISKKGYKFLFVVLMSFLFYFDTSFFALFS